MGRIPEAPLSIEVHDGMVEIGGRAMTPAKAFTLAEQICAKAYEAQGGPAPDADERYVQQLAREKRGAAPFEELYCQLRDVADDWHREAVFRRDSGDGIVDLECCDPDRSAQAATRIALGCIRDWDY